MRVADVMETRVDVAEASTSANEAWAHMQQHDLQSLIVTDAGRIVGILGRARLEGPGGEPHGNDRTLAELLPHEPVTIPAEYPVSRAVGLLEGDLSGCVAVLDHGRLVGVLTLSGLLRRLAMREARRRAS